MKNLGQVKNSKDIVTKQYTDDGLNKKANTDHRHDNATSVLDGFMSSYDKAKLNSVAYGATKVIVDDDFDENSTNTLQNKKITNKFIQIDDNIDLINDSAIRQQLIPVDTIIDLNNTISDMKPPILQGINDLKYQMIRRYYYDKNIVGVTEIKNIPSILKQIGIASMSILLDNELIPRTSDYVIRQTLVSIIDSDDPRVFERSYHNKYSTPNSGTWNDWTEITSFNIINDEEDKGLTIEKDYDAKILRLKHKDFLPNDSSTIGSTDNVFIETGTLFQLPYFKVNKQGHITQSGSGWYRIDSDHKVKQEPVNSSDDSRILLSTSNTDDEETGITKKSSKLTFNSYSGTLKTDCVEAKSFKGDGTNLTGVDKVKQEPVTNYNNSNYRVLFSNSATDDEETAVVKKYKDVYYNPYDGCFYSPTFSANAFKGNGSNITGINADNISSGTLSGDRLETMTDLTVGSYGKNTITTISDTYSSFYIPTITVDSKGRITNIADIKMSISGNLTDKNVAQTNITSSSVSSYNKDFKLLFSKPSDDDFNRSFIGETSIYEKLTYNPSTDILKVGNIETTGDITSDGTVTSRGLQCNGDLSVATVSASQIKATGSISGSGSGITNINASNIKSGTLSKNIIIEGNAATATKATTATSLESAININGISFDGSSNVINYGVCNSSSSTTEKVVDCPGFELINGATISVYFSNNNSVAQPTLNVNSTGAKNIVNKGYTNVFENYLNSGRVFTFIYISGSYHIISGEEFNLNSLVVAGSSTDTTTTTTALANSQVYLNMIEDGKVKSSFQIVGEGSTNVTTDNKGNISVKTSISSLPNPNALTIQGNGTTITTYDGSYARIANITPSNIGAATADHTHNYAGSSTAGGSATSAVKLDSSAGSATQPVYFSNGKPVATTYTLGKSVPSTAVFTDTDTKVTSSVTNPSTATTYHPTLVTGATTGGVYVNDGLSSKLLRGTASTEGYSVLVLGNDTAKGTAGNERGQINLYSSSTACSYIRQTDITSAITHYLPATGGTIYNTGNAFTTTVPLAAGTAATGSATTLSRSDHVHPLQTTIEQTPKGTGTQYLLTTTNSSSTTVTASSIGKSPLAYIDYSVDGALLCSRGLLSKRGNLIASGSMAISSTDYSVNITISNIDKYSILVIYISVASSLGHYSYINGTIPIQYLLNNTSESVKIGPLVSESSTSNSTIMQIAGYFSCSIDENSNALKLTAYDGDVVNGFNYYIYNLI